MSGTYGLTTAQLLALRAMASLGDLRRLVKDKGKTTLGYLAADGVHHSRTCIKALIDKGYAQRTGERGNYTISLTAKGKASMRTELGDYWCGSKPQLKLTPGYRKLDDDEVAALRLIASHGVVFYDWETRTYKPLSGPGEVQHALLQKMARFVWVTLTPKEQARITDAGVRIADAGMTAIE